MATSKTQPSQVNLKERIAALQQRSLSPTPVPISPPVPITPPLNSAGLRDKIAKFEKKGGVPIPRGSFGLGAPPPAENGQARRKGELYGNRLPSGMRNAGGSQSNSPFGSPLSYPTSMYGGEDLDVIPADLTGYHSSSSSSPISPASPFQTISPQTTGNRDSKSLSRGTPFTAALEHARRVESHIEASLRPISPRTMPSPGTTPASPLNPAKEYTDEGVLVPQISPPPFKRAVSNQSATPGISTPVDPTVAEPALPPTSVTLSPSREAQQSQVTSDDAPALEEPLHSEGLSTDQGASPSPETTPASPDGQVGESGDRGAPAPQISLLPLESAVSNEPSQVNLPVAEPAALPPPSIVLSPSREVGEMSSLPLESAASNDNDSMQVDLNAAEIDALPPPSIILSPSGGEDQDQTISGIDPTLEKLSEAEKGPVGLPSSNIISESESLSTNADIQTPETEPKDIHVNSFTSPHDDEEDGPTTSQVMNDRKEVPSADQFMPTTASKPSDNKLTPVSEKLSETATDDLSNSNFNTPSTDPSPMSPVGPFSLANAVHDLGQVVANIHNMFPGQISPLASPPPYRPFRLEVPPETAASKTGHSQKVLVEPTPAETVSSKSTSLQQVPSKTTAADTVSSAKEPTTPVKSKKFFADLEIDFDNLTSDPIHLTTPRTPRPVSMFETSPSHIAIAQRVNPATSRGVTVFLPASEPPRQQNYENFPPTPGANESEFGTVTLHKPSHSFSHSRNYSTQDRDLPQGAANKPPTFTAVVHRKITEIAPTSSSSYQSFYSPNLETPSKSQTSSPYIGEPPLSPGFGELATLLHEAALLELTLEQGQLPAETIRKNDSDKQESQKLQKERLEKDAAARAKVEEEKRKHEAVAKARAKQEGLESHSRGSLRNPKLRSKSSHKRDTSTDSTASSNPGRSKSLLLPFRPLPTPPPRQCTPPITSIPETKVAPGVDEKDPSLLQTSPKSPRQIFAGLKRLASTSRSSTPTGTLSRNSVSASSEMSSEDSVGIPTPPANGVDSAGSSAEASHGGIFGGSGLTWPSLSPKKSPTLVKAASFADKMWSRTRTKSTVSTNTAYEAIDRLTRPAAAQIPPLDPASFSFDVSAPPEVDLPSPPELVSPRRSASLYVPPTSQFPPVYSTRPTSSFYAPLPPSLPSKDEPQPFGLGTVFSGTLKSPEYSSGSKLESSHNFDVLFSAKPTSPVYTPHVDTMNSDETTTEQLTASPKTESLLPSPQDYAHRPSSWLSDMSLNSSTSSIPSPFFDSFPSVPDETPMPPALAGRQRNFTRPSLPLRVPSFFEPAPLSSTRVGTEFSVPSPFARNASARSSTMPRNTRESHQ